MAFWTSVAYVLLVLWKNRKDCLAAESRILKCLSSVNLAPEGGNSFHQEIINGEQFLSTQYSLLQLFLTSIWVHSQVGYHVEQSINDVTGNLSI
jgi:hypothetical protein